MRQYSGRFIEIDGRDIPYRLVTAHDYLQAKNDWDEEQADNFMDTQNEAYTLLNQIMALKQSCYLLRRTSYSCQSLSDNLYDLKLRLIRELSDCHDIQFDDEFVENYA